LSINHQRDAQARADRIAAFRAELAELEREDGLRLTSEQRATLEAHHARLLTALNRQYAVDIDDSAKRISLGMRIVSLLGAVAFFVGFVLFLHRIWGSLPWSAQVGVLAMAPLALVTATAWSLGRAVSDYYTALLAFAAGAAFVMGLSAAGVLLNLGPSPHALALWSLFAGLVAYACNLRLMLACGLVLLGGYAGALGASAGGAFWGSFMERPLWVIPAGALFYAVPLLTRHARSRDFEFVYRACGAGLVLTALLVLSFRDDTCCFGTMAPTGKMLYQLTGLGLSLAVVAHGLRLGRGGLVNLGSAGFVVFLLVRLHAWWWDWMPKYLFCICIGLTAVVLLAAFRRVRRRLVGRVDTPAFLGDQGEASSGIPCTPASKVCPSWLWVGAALVVLAANLGAVVSGLRNRSEDRGGTIELTERELRLPQLMGESTVMLLGLQWAAQGNESWDRGAPVWLTAAKLEELGFDCREPATAPGARDYYNSMAPRTVYLVLEFEGQAWQEASRHRKPRTHLYAVDAGSDSSALRQRYPDSSRHAVARAVIRPLLQTHNPVDDRPLAEPRLTGWIQELLPGQIFVPRPHSTVLQGLRRPGGQEGGDADSPPRYAVTVSWGTRCEPWIRSVRLLPGE